MQKKHSKKLFLILFSIVAIAIFSSASYAQSGSIDNPTPLKSRVLTGELIGNSNKEYFYSFIANPGEFTVTADVTTTNYNSTLDVTLISNANRGSGFVASAVHKGTDRSSKVFNTAKRKKIVMKLKDFSASDGTFKITLSGAIALPK